MKPALKGICVKCLQNIRKNLMTCSVCQSKYHRVCSDIKDDIIVGNVLALSKNIVFLCNDCLNVNENSTNLISSISRDVQELKLLMKNILLVASLQHVKIFSAKNYKIVGNYLNTHFKGKFCGVTLVNCVHFLHILGI